MRYSDEEIGAALRALRLVTSMTAAEAADKAGLTPTILLHKAETGKAALTGAQLSAVLDVLGSNFQVLHLKLQRQELSEAALSLLGSMAQLMQEAGK